MLSLAAGACGQADRGDAPPDTLQFLAMFDAAPAHVNYAKVHRDGMQLGESLFTNADVTWEFGTLDASATGPRVLKVEAALGHPDWGIVQSPFMRDNAKTVAFKYEGTVDGDSFRYAETTSLEIYDRSFEHTDENELVRKK